MCVIFCYDLFVVVAVVALNFCLLGCSFYLDAVYVAVQISISLASPAWIGRIRSATSHVIFVFICLNRSWNICRIRSTENINSFQLTSDQFRSVWIRREHTEPYRSSVSHFLEHRAVNTVQSYQIVSSARFFNLGIFCFGWGDMQVCIRDRM